MINIIDKINLIIDKIGKRNFLLAIFVLVTVLVGGLLGTFSIFTSTDGVSIIDGITTYKFILNADNTTNSVTIAAGSSKLVALTISNPEKLKLKYGIYYSSSNDLTGVNIGYLNTSEHIGTDIIDADSDYIVNIKINNSSSSNVTITFGTTYGLEKGGDLTLPDGKIWLEEEKKILASTYIQNLYNDGSSINTVNIGGDTSNPQVSLNATQGIMLDNNGDIRYYGANPNNYVSYNNELWRIISVGNVKSSESDTTGETRVKIVKADILTAKETGTSTDITAFSYDSSASTVNSGNGVNDWSKADLMTELNTLYYNSTSGTCYTGRKNASKLCDFTNTGLSAEARNLTADALYYLGGSSTYYGLYADDYYTFERGTEVYGCGKDDVACPRATTWTGRIGIIYPSDYVYATDLSVCTKDGYNYNTDTNCYNKDWLLYASNYQWTIAPDSSAASYAFLVFQTGSVDGYLYVRYAGAVRPVQYLRSNVAIVGGEGTSGDPYQLELS